MQNFSYKENTFICKIKSLYTINKLCVVIEIIANYFPYGLKMLSRNTEPQPDSASYKENILSIQFFFVAIYV